MDPIERLISEINKSINDQNNLIDAGIAPNEFKNLESKIEEFTLVISNLKDKQKKQYVDILGVWSEQIRSISDKINSKMQEIQTHIEGAKSQGKAVQSYKYLDN